MPLHGRTASLTGLGNASIGAAKQAAAQARDAELEPMLRELSHLSSREITAELAKRGHKVSYRTVQRMLEHLEVY
jgi:hypothetical protein